jgi:hypothetical protein
VTHFMEAEVVSLGRVRHLDTLLEALDVGMPKEAVVYVEGTSFSEDVCSALSALPQVPVEQRRTDLQGTLSPEPTCFHLRVDTGVLRVLRDLETRHALPEVCDHLAVYRGEEILALAHDACGTPLLVGLSLPASAVEKMRAVVECDRAARPTASKRLLDRIRRLFGTKP